MGKLLRVFLCACAFGAIVLGSLQAQAEIKVTISDGNKTIDPSMATNGMYGRFRLSAPTSPGAEKIFRLLQCATTSGRCTVYFPSGKEQADSTDTYMFRDWAWPGYPANAKKSETSVARLMIYDVEITALPKRPAKPLTITFETELNDLKRIDGTTGSQTFPFMPQLDGRFQQGWTASKSCKNATSADPCVKLVVNIYAMSTSSPTTREVTVPCPNVAVNPCGPGGYYTAITGWFNTMRPAEFPCNALCDPIHKATITGKFTEDYQVLTFRAAATLLSPYTVEEYGVEDVAYAAAEYTDDNLWVSFSTSSQSADKGLVLTAIASDEKLSEPERFKNDRS